MLLYIIEITALAAVSLVWYWSIVRVVRRGHATPIRPAVITVLCAGLLVGMAAKLSELAATGAMDPLFWLHGFNLVIVFIDFRLTAHFARGRHRLREPMSEATTRALVSA